MPALVTDPATVDAGWLTEVLRAAGALAPPGAVAGFTADRIGTGNVSDTVRFRLAYQPDRPTGPASLVAKFASSDPASRAAGVATRTYEVEVAFYTDLAATVAVNRPACYFAAIDPGTADVVVVLADLAPATPGDQLAGCTVAEAELAVAEAAQLHAPRWGDPTLLDLPWLAELAEPSTGIADLYTALWPGFADRYGAGLPPAAHRLGADLAGGIGGWTAHRPAAFTVTHGDFRLDNMMFRPGRRLAVVDWQTVRPGCGTADVAYFLGTALEPAARRDCERGLVAAYHRDLVAAGVTGYPLDACTDDYRRHSPAGFVMAVIASMLVGRSTRGDAMFLAMATRSAAQADDLFAAEFLR